MARTPGIGEGERTRRNRLEAPMTAREQAETAYTQAIQEAAGTGNWSLVAHARQVLDQTRTKENQ